MQINVLGPLEVRMDGTILRAGAPRQRAVLALLALHPNEVVSRATIIEALWGEQPPDSAVATVRTYLWRLRQMLSAGSGAEIVSAPPGYVLTIDRDAVDACRFERLVRDARRVLEAGDPRGALRSLDDALGLWRGEPLADIDTLDVVRPVLLRLEQIRVVADEDRIDASLALGRHAEVIGDLEALTSAHPFRERLWAQLIVALYRSGRQADALAAYSTLRTNLVESLGVEPGPSLRALEQDVLGQAEHLGAPEPPPGREPVTTPASRADRSAAHRLPPVPSFVGRSTERALINVAVEEARCASFGAIFVGGPPGIGKTALMTRCALDAQTNGIDVFVGRADEEAGRPFQVLAEVIRTWVANARDDEIAALDDRCVPHLTRLVPALADLRPAGVPSSERDRETDRLALFEAIAHWVEVAAARRPVLIMLDDLQWADKASVLAIRHLLRHPPTASALILGAHRDLPVDPDHDLARLLLDSRRELHVRHVGLGGLHDGEVVDLVRSEIGGAGTVDTGFVAKLNELTAGSPLLLVEMLRHLRENGDLAPEDERWPTPLLDGHVPPAVSHLILQRVRSLPVPSASILKPAAVLGEHFDFTVLCALAETPEVVAMKLLEPALDAKVVEAEGPRGHRFRFSHSLVRHTVLDGLSLSERAQLHWRAGTIISELSDPRAGTRRGEIAYHLAAGVHAGDPHTAIAANVQAGQLALASLGWEDAVERFTEATDLLESTGVVDDSLAFSAWLGLGQARGGLDQRGGGSPARRGATAGGLDH